MPLALRRTAGIDAPSDLLLIPGPDGVWAVMAASVAARALTLLAGLGHPLPPADQPDPATNDPWSTA